MALDKAGLKSAIKSALDNIQGDGATTEEASTALSDAIDDYVKSALATVHVPAGTFLVAAQAGVPNPAPVALTGGPTTTPPGGLS